MNLETIAQQLVDMKEKIILIFAFNSTGKTQLSIAYKNATKDESGRHAGVYYNAFSEDLFTWDNESNIRLKVLPSSLNKFHSILLENEDFIMQKLAAYHPKYRYKLNKHSDVGEVIESISFFIEGAEDVPIKISRGEERIFVWCFFLALLEAEGWADECDAHIFIDDPVSSLDEHNIFITANALLQQIETDYKKKKIIITTHHIGLFSILSNLLTKGEKSSTYKELTGLYMLKIMDGEAVLESHKSSVFLFHLHLLKVLNEARESQQLYTYHFALLRQLLENISSFQGSGMPSRVLKKMGKNNVDELMNLINTHSHKTPYYYQTEMMSDSDKAVFSDIFQTLVDKYHFNF